MCRRHDLKMPGLGLTVYVAIAGSASADQAYAAIVDHAVGVVQPPRIAAPGWWLIDAEIAPASISSLTHGLRSLTALMIVTGVADFAVLTLYDPGASPVTAVLGEVEDLLGVPPRVVEVPEVAAWIRGHAPAKPGAKALINLWASLAGVNGHEIAEAVLRRLGYHYAGRGPLALMEGCTGVVDALPSPIAETRVDYEAVRWVLGTGDDFWGLWDMDHPGPPSLRFSNREDAVKAQWDRVAQPILDRTVLPGVRRWAPLLPGPGSARAAFYHFSPDSRLSVVYATEPPRTRVASRPGSLSIARACLRAVGIDDKVPFDRVPIRDEADADRLAWGALHRRLSAIWGRDPSPWIDIPDDVPKKFLITSDWVRRSASGD